LPIVDKADIPDGYDDPTRSGNPLLDVRGKHAEHIHTNVTVQEFARIDPKLVSCVQDIRNTLGPVTINSGYRPHLYNNEIDGASQSQHMGGRAADIASSGKSGLDIAKTAIDKCGCNIGVGVGKSYAHVDVRGTYASWEYDPGLESDINEYHANVCK
jgi:uncharacterized protein YcbK (DUF882 family)